MINQEVFGRAPTLKPGAISYDKYLLLFLFQSAACVSYGGKKWRRHIIIFTLSSMNHDVIYFPEFFVSPYGLILTI